MSRKYAFMNSVKISSLYDMTFKNYNLKFKLILSKIVIKQIFSFLAVY